MFFLQVYKALMSDSVRKRPGDESPGNGQKRGRGPADCLNWEEESDEEEFTPFTQENPVLEVVEPVPSKSSGGRNKKKKALDKAGKHVVAKKSTAKNKLRNPSKGKCPGNIFLNELFFNGKWSSFSVS